MLKVLATGIVGCASRRALLVYCIRKMSRGESQLLAKNRHTHCTAAHLCVMNLDGLASGSKMVWSPCWKQLGAAAWCTQGGPPLSKMHLAGHGRVRRPAQGQR
jgi:hypothetical protein